MLEAQTDPATTAEALLATCDADWAGWLAAQKTNLSLELIHALKQRSDALIKAHPPEAERISRAALAVAAQLPAIPLAWPLARWVRGNWAAYNHPTEAVTCYQDALVGYEQAGDVAAIARLSSNLVFAYTGSSRFHEALRAAERARELLTRSGASAEHYLINLGINQGWLLYCLNRYTEALAINAVTMGLAQRFDKIEEWAELQVNQAITLGMVDRLPEGEALLLNSRAILAERGQHLTVARIDMDLGIVYSHLGHLVRALRCFQLAIEGFELLGNLMECGSVLLFEADLLRRLGALPEALRSYARAQQRFTDHGMPQFAINALLAGAMVRRKLNPEDHRVVALLTEALHLAEGLNLPVVRAEIALERAALALDLHDYATADTLLNQPLPPTAPPALVTQYHLLCGLRWLLEGRTDAARSALQLGLATSQKGLLIWEQRAAHAALGRCLLASDPHEARRQLEAAARIDEEIRAGLSVAELMSNYQAQRGDVLPRLVRLAVNAGHSHAALHAAWRWSGGVLCELLIMAHQGTLLAPSDQSDPAPLLQKITVLRWQASRHMYEETPTTEREAFQAQIRELEQRYRTYRRYRNQGQHPQPAAPAVQVGAVLAHLDADRLIEYVRCDDDLLALCADRHGTCTATWLGPADAVIDLLGRLDVKCLQALTLPPPQRPHQLPRLAQATQAILQRLHALLIAPLVDLPTTGQLLIVPCAPLHLVPFAALWDGETYLIERYVLEQIPSGLLLNLPTAPAPSVGAPIIIGASSEGALGAVHAEVAAVAAALPGCTRYLDDPAAVAQLTALPVAPRLLHISAHSVFEPEPSIFSGLQLTGAMLTIEQCYHLRLTGTELVVLSGCKTAAGMESGGSLLAFQSALLIAGAQRVLSSHWPIRDDLAAQWMAVFYGYLAHGATPTAAMRATQCELMHTAASAHPAIWAAFTLIRR